MPTVQNRRQVLTYAGAAALGASALVRHAWGQQVPRVAPITMVINQSPWFGGFRQLVEQYTRDTGTKIELDVNPYAGALDKIRNSLRASAGSYDLLAIDNNWMVEFFDGGFLVPLTDLEPGFKLDPQINTFGGTIFWNEKVRSFDAGGGKLMGVPLGCDVCYTNHAEADQDDMDNLLTLLGAAGVTYIMGVPGADDVMLNYQSTSFHDALYLRRIFGFKHAPEFSTWLAQRQILNAAGQLQTLAARDPLLRGLTALTHAA